ncbi:scavenger receptor cysteine-rich type 1 protein M130-like, partial [Salarias fasciatus]|uniref:scavenger receptor cysteine-rich type 1 protein M130-like n=1 Tax=Salarias fasciatus TaxID=181472 RepID=UPI001176F80C
VGGSSGCSGGLELKHLGEWRPVDNNFWNLKIASDSVRLLNGSSRCSGRLQVKTNPSDQTWSSVCEADLDLQDAQVVCRELGCGAPSVLQGVLYGDVQTPRWSPEFQCGGHESALLDCRSSGSARSSCSPGKAAGLTCSGVDEFRLVGGASRCAGSLELKYLGEQRPVVYYLFMVKTAALICEHLNCGSTVSLPTGVVPFTCCSCGALLAEQDRHKRYFVCLGWQHRRQWSSCLACLALPLEEIQRRAAFMGDTSPVPAHEDTATPAAYEWAEMSGSSSSASVSRSSTH